ncbi:Crp/Fnr family transcriptional regulator [[Clostridium] fimetarium]|uniref:cAMP-binding domain of CRP or a regulatory subunit of cAMP-dependent protein kinases n=1 Tax=[Clostridium] fimetarium TaxID=99656 RepID=A0A1I0RP30_9FIRM|nr:Crp/Fnr family transcriptional regulator [[Clostridium] fimetarium]SEW43121.1 cAMP-binding domain of CRP or a regulatory subunit of cAMP-dependent protein kinases [[Clostridium] fimetarium]
MKQLEESYLKDYDHIPLFYGINNKDLLSMMKCLGSYIKTYKKGEFIILTDQTIRCIGVILEGSVKMIKEDLWGNKTILAVMEKGELFGETFACGDISVATVAFVAGKDVKILYLKFPCLLHTCFMSCEYHNILIGNMVRLIANKNLQLMEKLEITTKKTIREKISTYLSIQAQHHNSEHFTVAMGRVELAEYLCTDRSSLTRELNRIKSEGCIEFNKNTFKILKVII